jgi:hypothetical protein
MVTIFSTNFRKYFFKGLPFGIALAVYYTTIFFLVNL